MNYIIEQASFKDLDDIHKLIYDRCLWFKKMNVKGWNLEYYPNKYNKTYFEEQMKINKLFVAKENDKICGVMLLKKEDYDFWKDNKTAYYVHHLTTDTKLKGIGKLLLNYAIEQCKKDNKEYLRLDCYKTSEFLNKYYNMFGFINVGHGTLGTYNYNLWEMRI